MKKTYGNMLDSENTEIYTPKDAVDMIIPYLKKEWTIWAPFSEIHHNFVGYLRDKGFKVINSHIREGKDFLNYKPLRDGDIILDNPPFKNKMKGIKRCVELGKPFILLLPLHTLNDLGAVKLFMDKKLSLEVLLPDRRVEYTNAKNKGISFKSIYFCHNVLPEKLILTKYIKGGE